MIKFEEEVNYRMKLIRKDQVALVFYLHKGKDMEQTVSELCEKYHIKLRGLYAIERLRYSEKVGRMFWERVDVVRVRA